MEYLITIVITIVSIIILKMGLNLHIKDIKRIKEIGYDKKLNEIANKFPENKLICEAILEKLNNKKVKIEEESNTKTSLYIAVSNTIIIANIKAIIAVIGKILQIIYAVVTKNEEYKATRVFTQERLEQLKVA